MSLFVPNRQHGKLIIVEGIDGSGKSTQISLLSRWLRSQGYAVAFSEWNSSPLVRQTTRRGKKKEMFTPTTFSLIHATDFADRSESYILPLLKAGAIVCADRYAFTAYARDVARGVSRRWVRNLYRFAIRPDLAFYFRVPLDVAMEWTWASAATWKRASAFSRAAFWTNTRPWRRRWVFGSSMRRSPSKNSRSKCAKS
jgi:dTMP kinase